MNTRLVLANASRDAQALTDMASVLVPFDPFDTDTWVQPKTKAYWIMRGVIRIGIMVTESDAGVASDYFDDLPECPGSQYVLLIGVLPSWRRKGVAKWALQELIFMAQVASMRVVQSNCRESNLASKRLHLSSGFKVSGKIPGYYPNPLEDTITFSMDI
jgi:RimJ/RimL family protein N-acetyltransferase